MANLQNLTQTHILNALKLEHLPENDRVALLDEIAAVINQKVLLRVFEAVSPSDQKKLASMLDKDPEKVEGFIAEKVPQFLDILGEEIEKMKEKLLSYGKA